MAGSFLTVVAREGGRLVGAGRALSDGGLYAWIHDVVVVRDQRRRGIALRICAMMVDALKERGIPYIGLFAAKGAAPLYERVGFTRRPDDAPGMQLYLAPEFEEG